jgi:glucose-6-phosphate 1-dehydrogenase
VGGVTAAAEAPPLVRLYPQGSWWPKSVQQLIAPHAWWLPFERTWRGPNKTEG